MQFYIRHIKKAFLFLLAASLVSCTCKKSTASKKATPKQSITINIQSEPSTLDPRKLRALNDANMVRALMEGLMRTNQDGISTPALAESYTVSPDFTTYTFTLRETKWSNGDPVRASDFVYAWKKSLHPDFPSDNAFLLFPIKYAKLIKEGSLPSSMLGAFAKDDHTLIVHLEYPVPFFLDLVSAPIFFPINQRIDLESNSWALSADTFVGNGPFLLKEWKHKNEITLVKNPSYWDAKSVKLESINMIMVDPETGLNLFHTHALDWEGSPFSTIPIDSIESLKVTNQIYHDPLLGTYWIRTNTKAFPLTNPHLRKALALAINRHDIIEHVTHGFQIPATGIVPVCMGLQDTPHFNDASFDQSKNLLLSALEEDHLDLNNFPTITLSYVADTRNHRIAQAIQDQWLKTLGIHVNLEALEAKVYFDRISKGDYELASGSWIADFRDPINFLEVFKTKHVGTNNTAWESLDYQKALDNAYLVSSPQDRLTQLKTSEKILMDEMPVIPIFHYVMLHVKNDRLKNVILTESGSIDFKWAYVE